MAKGVPGRKDIESRHGNACVCGSWGQWLALPESEDLGGECGKSAPRRAGSEMPHEGSGLPGSSLAFILEEHGAAQGRD